MNRKSRKRLSDLCKIADREQNGIFQHFQSNVTEYATREKYLTQRGGEPIGRSTDDLYGLAPEGDDSYMPEETKPNSLSTRYSPDRPGVQARRIADGVFQDPYTNKIYDYNDGFKTEDGRSFPGGSPALQSSMMRLSNHLDQQGLIKEADYLDSLINKAAGGSFSYHGPNPDDALSTEEIGRLSDLGWLGNNFKEVDKSTPSVREALGLDSSGASARENRPLTTAEISKLLLENNDAGSSYKLDPARLAEMTNGNLTSEEAAIVDGLTLQASVKNYLIAFASHLDLQGLTEEADKLDCIVRSAK